MSKFDLKQCDKACQDCILSYVKKHQLRKGDSFKVNCSGIPLEYIPDNILASFGQDPEMALAMFNPVLWANKFLDWHCEDLDGKIWKRKTEEGTLPPNARAWDSELARKGKSIFHRPYQKLLLACSSKRKVLRLGRQLGKSEVLVIITLYSIFTNKDFKVLLIAPYQSQIEMLFSRINGYISSNPVLYNSVARNVKAPNFQIQLYNGSALLGFTAGSRSGQDAGSARGQTCHMLIYDEMDMLSSGDIQATLATILNSPDATVWMSSTPTGKREKFYESANSSLYKEFHYPSWINPNWNEELESYFRSEYTDIQYDLEVAANFGEQEEGVYQIKHVQAAQSDYNYGDYQPRQNWTYMIGVDWNDVKIGSTIAVVGFNHKEGVFYIVDKHIVAKSEWTQISACQKVAEYSRKWMPAAVYLDRGFGGAQYEIIRKYGADCVVTEGPNGPNARLRNITKQYDFGSSIEIVDPFTKQKVKKPAKPFLVENSVRRFEQHNIKYPRSDDKYTKSLLGYVIKRVSQSGQPIYEEQNEKVGDHFLDAVNLALIGFTLEKSEFGKIKYQSNIAFSSQVSSFLKGNVNTNETFKKQAENYKPKLGRAAITPQEQGRILTTEADQMPASNHNLHTQTRLFDWPGWGHDAPRPQPKSQQFTKRFRRQRPSRSKF